MVFEHAFVRRRPGEASRQPDRSGVESGVDADSGPLGFGVNRLERQILLDRLARALVNVAGSGADLCVRVFVDVFE